MKAMLAAAILVGTIVHAQEPLTVANKCFDEKNYPCVVENYKKALAEKKFQEKDRAEILLRIGYGDYELKQYEEALRYFKDALAAKPDWGDAYWEIANTLYAMKEYDEASDYYGKAIDQFKDNKSELKRIYYLRGLSYSQLDKHADALTYYKLAMAIDSTVGNYQAKAGDASYNLQQYGDAIRYYQKAISIGASDKKIMSLRYHWLGEANFKLKNYDAAFKSYSGALEYNPENKSAQWGKAAVFYSQEKWPEAIAEYSKTIVFYKDDTTSLKDLYYYRGRAYVLSNDYAKGLADFDAILKLDPANRSAIWQKGMAFRKQKKYKEAVLFFNQAVELYKDDTKSLDDLTYFRGHCYLQLKDTAKAKADFQKALSYNSGLSDANVEMGNLSFAAGKYYEAKDYYSKSISAYKADSSELSMIWFRKGISNLITGVGYTGKADLETSIRYDSLNKTAHRYMGEVHFNGSSFALALQEFDKCVRLYKNDKDSLPKMYAYRGMAYSKLGKYKEALSDYEQADKLKPNQLEYVTGIGQLAFETKEYAKVQQSFTKAIGLYKPVQKNELAFAYYARGRAYHELKNKEKAKQDMEKAIELVPTYAEAKKWLETITKAN